MNMVDRRYNGVRQRCRVAATAIHFGAALVAGFAVVPAAAQGTVQASAVAFDIPAQPLAEALMRFGQQSGLQVSADNAALGSLRSSDVSGRFSPSEALNRLLAGTGVTYRFIGANTVTIAGAADDSGVTTLGPVVVEGRAVPPQAGIDNLPPVYPGGEVARGGSLGMLGNRDIMDTPFNQTNYTSELIRNQQARTIQDVVANDPSVRASWPSAGYANPLVIRGFQAGNQDVSFNGLYGVAPAFSVDVGMAERIEVLKGPNALLSGMQPLGGVGGGVNVVPKRAGADPVTAVTGNYVSDTQVGGGVDIGRRFGANDDFGIRFNGTLSDGDTAVDDQSRTFGSGVAALDYIGESVRLTVDAGYQQHDYNAPTLLTFIGNGVPMPDAPDASTNWFFPWSWVDNDDTFGAVRGEVDLTPDWTVHAAAGGRKTNWSRWSYFPTVTNAAGDLTGTPGHLESVYLTDSEEGGLRGRFATGGLGHEMSLAATRFHQETQTASQNAAAAIASNLYNPSSAESPAISDLDPAKTGETELVSFAISDVVSLYDERIQLVLGGRQQNIETTNFNGTTGAVTTSYDKSVVTPAVGFVVKPVEMVSVYGNYIEGLQQGTVVGGTYANAGETLEPFVSEQYEVGVKVDWGRIATTASLFQITQPSGTAPSPSGTFAADGEQRNRGLELNVFGEATQGVRLLGGVTLLDATLTSTANGANDGNDAPGIPDVQVNIGSEWDVPFLPGLTLTGLATYTGDAALDTANTRTIPAWATIDIGARYAFAYAGTPVTLRADVKNVADNDYWSSGAYAAGWVSPGAPRTFLFSMSAEF